MEDVEEAPVVRLVNAILLEAMAKGATAIRVRADLRGHSHVELELDGAFVLVMTPPSKLHGHVVRRLGVMASLPLHRKGETAKGRLGVRFGSGAEGYFSVEIEGHGDATSALLRRLDPDSSPTA